jgi:peroxiredoxin Q/BCP
MEKEGTRPVASKHRLLGSRPPIALEPDDKAPSFSRPDQAGVERTRDDYAGKRLVIYFYPRVFTPGCTTQACDLRDNYATFQDAGYEIVGVSPDPVDKLEPFRVKHDLPFPLLSDHDLTMSKAYGAWGIKKNYGREYEGLIRSTIVVDGDGLVTHAWYNVKAKGHAERIERELVG